MGVLKNAAWFFKSRFPNLTKCVVDVIPDLRPSQAHWLQEVDADIRTLRVSGACMRPRLRSGDIALIDIKTPPNPGDLVVVTFDGKFIGKRFLRREGEWIRTFTENPPCRVSYPADSKMYRVVAVLPAAWCNEAPSKQPMGDLTFETP